MSLRFEEIDDYFVLLFPDMDAETRAAVTGRFRERLEHGQRRLEDFFVARNGTQLTGAVRLAELGGGLYSLLGPAGDADASASLLEEAVARARALDATGMSARPRADRELGSYPEALQRAGFEFRGERAEFQADVCDLPDDDGTPLRWASMRETGRAAAAELYAAARRR